MMTDGPGMPPSDYGRGEQWLREKLKELHRIGRDTEAFDGDRRGHYFAAQEVEDEIVAGFRALAAPPPAPELPAEVQAAVKLAAPLIEEAGWTVDLHARLDSSGLMAWQRGESGARLVVTDLGRRLIEISRSLP